MTLLRRILRDDAWKLAAYSVILFGNALATVLAFPAFEKNYQAILQFVPGFLKNLRFALFDAGASGLSTFCAINHLFKGANVLGVAAAILLAMGTVAREAELGTAGMLLSRPLSRRRILFSWTLVHLLELTVPLLLATLAIPLVASLALDESIAAGPLLLGALHAAVFLALIYALSLLVSTLVSEQIQVAGIAGGICVASFILYFLDATRAFTLYRFSSFEIYADLARGESLPVTTTLGLAAAAIALLALADRVFARRDF